MNAQSLTFAFWQKYSLVLWIKYLPISLIASNLILDAIKNTKLKLNSVQFCPSAMNKIINAVQLFFRLTRRQTLSASSINGHKFYSNKMIKETHKFNLWVLCEFRTYIVWLSNDIDVAKANCCIHMCVTKKNTVMVKLRHQTYHGPGAKFSKL